VSRLQAHLTLLDSLPWLDVEASSRCNVACTICPRHRLTRGGGLLESPTFDALLGWLPRECCLMFSGLGEPLLNPWLPEYLGALHRRGGVTTGVTTNGTLLATPGGRAFLEQGPHWLQVSLHSADPARAEAVMPGARFEDVLRGLELASSLLPPTTTRRLCAVVEDEGEVQGLRALAQKLGWELFLRRPHSRAGALRPCASAPAPGCGIFAKVHFVTWRGELLACCQDLDGSTRLGTLWSRSFEELIRLKRTTIVEGSWPALCSRCDDDHRTVLLDEES